MECFIYKLSNVREKSINLDANYNDISLSLLPIFLEYFQSSDYVSKAIKYIFIFLLVLVMFFIFHLCDILTS